MPHWKRNVYVLCFVQLVTMIGFAGYQPFIPYFMMDLGVPTYAETTSWQAVFNTGAAVAMMIASPIWGALADRHGRRLMLIRATAAGAVFAFFMGFAQTPGQLVVLRIVQSLFSGTVAAAMTMVATETPEEYLGRSLGMMQTAQFVGQSIGPLLGGMAADSFGYRNVFYQSAGLMLVAAIMAVVFVTERKRPRPATAGSRAKGHANPMAAIANRNTMVLILALAGNSFALAVLSPVLSLYIMSLVGTVPNLATIAGSIMSVSALSSSVSAIALGRLADKIGQKTVLVACVIGVALVHVPQAMVSHPNQLMLWRAIQGIFMGGIMPTANALLARATASSRRGAVYGFAHSAQAGGRAVGPMVGAMVSNAYGMPSTFLTTAGLFGLMSVAVAIFVHMRPAPAEEVAEDAADAADAPTPAAGSAAPLAPED